LHRRGVLVRRRLPRLFDTGWQRLPRRRRSNANPRNHDRHRRRTSGHRVCWPRPDYTPAAMRRKLSIPSYACAEILVIPCAAARRGDDGFFGGEAMRRVAACLALIAVAAASSVVLAQGGFKRISEFLTGYEETPSAFATTGNVTFTARISNDESRIDWELSYSDLQGAVQQAHIHFGQLSVTGPISVFLCTNLGNGPAGTQPCPPPPATISGTIVAADVTNLANERGISAGELEELML